jgi:hypothetical protein
VKCSLLTSVVVCMKHIPPYYTTATDDTSGVRTYILEMFVIEKTAIRKLQAPKESPIFETGRSTVCYILITENYIYTAAFTQKRILGPIRRTMHFYSHGIATCRGP